MSARRCAPSMERPSTVTTTWASAPWRFCSVSSNPNWSRARLRKTKEEEKLPRHSHTVWDRVCLRAFLASLHYTRPLLKTKASIKISSDSQSTLTEAERRPSRIDFTFHIETRLVTFVFFLQIPITWRFVVFFYRSPMSQPLSYVTHKHDFLVSIFGSLSDN